jgi:hypothetical protein
MTVLTVLIAKMEGRRKRKGKSFYALVIWDMFVSVRVTVMV